MQRLFLFFFILHCNRSIIKLEPINVNYLKVKMLVELWILGYKSRLECKS